MGRNPGGGTNESLGPKPATEIDQLARDVDRGRNVVRVEGGKDAATQVPDPWLFGYRVAGKDPVARHVEGCRAIGLAPRVKGPSGRDHDRLAGIEVGQRLLVGGKDRDLLDEVARLVGERSDDFPARRLDPDREGALVGDADIILARDDLPGRLVGGCRGRDPRMQRARSTERSKEARARGALATILPMRQRGVKPLPGSGYRDRVALDGRRRRASAAGQEELLAPLGAGHRRASGADPDLPELPGSEGQVPVHRYDD